MRARVTRRIVHRGDTSPWLAPPANLFFLHSEAVGALQAVGQETVFLLLWRMHLETFQWRKFHQVRSTGKLMEEEDGGHAVISISSGSSPTIVGGTRHAVGAVSKHPDKKNQPP